MLALKWISTEFSKPTFLSEHSLDIYFAAVNTHCPGKEVKNWRQRSFWKRRGGVRELGVEGIKRGIEKQKGGLENEE